MKLVFQSDDVKKAQKSRMLSIEKAGFGHPLGLDRAGTVEQDVKSTSGHRGVGNPGVPAGVLLSGESLPFRVLRGALRSG